METSVLRQFSVNYKQIIIDEIALEGLEGISIDLLWRRTAKRLSADLTPKMRARFWGFIVNNSKLSFYEIPEPFPYLEIMDRFTIIDENTGHLKDPDDYVDGPYEHKLIDGEHGSSRFFDVRKPLTELQNMSYEDVIAMYGDKLVIVASIEERWHALASHLPITYLSNLMPTHYSLLELIGKSRDNGQMSVGTSNLHKIIKDSKTLFYFRKHLQDLDLIDLQNVTQVINGKGIKCLLIRLKRFHKPGVLTIPKVGILHDVINYLLKAPNYCERTDFLVKRGVLTQKQNRRLQKTVNIFNFEDRSVQVDDPNVKTNKKQKLMQKRKYIFLASKSDESADSDEDPNETPMTCQYKVGVNLMRQAYEQFLDAGLKGLTQVQLSHLLGIEFYTARAICRIFRLRNIVREYLEDKGKQRMARYIAVVATEKMDKKYEEQRNTFLEYLTQCKTKDLNQPTTSQQSISDDEVPLKKIKLEKTEYQTKLTFEDDDMDTPKENEITEIKVLDGFENSKALNTFKKNPTLRQLKFANGILKVLNEKLCISGYMTLSNLASKEVNEPPMHTKALKCFIQRLATDGHIKMYKIKWPALHRYTVLICAHHVKATDALVQAKYKEICMRAVINKKASARKEIAEKNPAPAKVKRSYPRYMKIQKLHEFVLNVTYLDFVKPESHTMSQGFVCVIDLFPEATVEFLINNLCTSAATEMYQLITESQLQLKLKDAPPKIFKALMKSKVIQNSVRLNLKALAMLGLIQLIGPQTAVTSTAGHNNYSNFLFYVNRNAKLLDTSGTWPRTKYDGEEIIYRFETPADITKYWHDVYNISTNTEIVLPIRGRKHLQTPLRAATDVELYDTGERFGDGLGPCGFDSCFYMDVPRLWQTFYSRPFEKTPTTKKKAKTPKFEIVKKSKAKPKPKPKRPKKRVVEKIPSPVKRRRHDGSVKWSKREDLIITICKAAITIMSPSSQPGSLIVRNIVAKDLLSISDPKKTKGLCHSRASTLDTNITLIHEKQCIINEMRRRRNLVQKYEGLLKKLRLNYSTNMTKYINKARIPMMELIWIILQVMRSKSYTERMPCVAVSLADFHSNFTITTSTANKLYNIYKISENSPLKEAIMVTVMQTIDSELDTETAKKIFTTFKRYPESALRIAVEQLRKCTAIAAKEKLFNNQFRKLDLEDIVQSSYKISAFYRRKWICRLNCDFADKLFHILDTVEDVNDIKGSAEINCAVCELEACGLMEIQSTTAPVMADAKGNPVKQGEMSAKTIDMKYNLKTGSMRWRKKTEVSDIYHDIDFTECIEYLSTAGVMNVNEVHDPEVNDQVISHLKQKGDKGATFLELQNLFGYDIKTLAEKLQKLETEKVIRRVGFYENIVILPKHYKSWSTQIGDQYIICTPWLNLNSGLKYDVLIKWAGVIMNSIFEKPGSTIAYISDRFECITYRAVQDICMFLLKLECVTLSILKTRVPDLFSEENVEPELYEFNPFYDPENMLVFPTKNCMTKYSYLRKRIISKYSGKSCRVDEDYVG